MSKKVDELRHEFQRYARGAKQTPELIIMHRWLISGHLTKEQKEYIRRYLDDRTI